MCEGCGKEAAVHCAGPEQNGSEDYADATPVVVEDGDEDEIDSELEAVLGQD